MEQQQLDQMAQQGGGAIAAVFSFIYLVVMVLMIVGMWKVFVKAGEPGWAAIIPIYNIVVLVKISGKPMWWVLVYLSGCLTIVAAIVCGLGTAKNFGKSEGYGIGLGLLPMVFYPMLGFGDAQFVGQKTA